MKLKLRTKLGKALQERKEDLFFKLLFDEFGDYIIAWALSYGLDHDRAFEPEDIQIEVFIRLSKNGLEPYSPERFVTLGSYIYRTTQNVLNTNYRNGIRIPKDSLDDNLPSERLDLLIENDSLEFKDFLDHLLSKIKPMEAAVFKLFLDGAAHKEIAAELGISVVNSRQYLCQARRALKELALKYYQSIEKL